MMRRAPLVVMVFAFVLAACGGADDGGAIDLPETTPPPAGDDGGTVAASLTEWDVGADPSTVAAGSITFEVSNDGTQAHEFVIIATDLAPDSLPVEGGAVPEDAEGIDLIAEIEPYQPGESKTLTSTLSAGSYVLICNVPGHYQQGMNTGFTVT